MTDHEIDVGDFKNVPVEEARKRAARSLMFTVQACGHALAENEKTAILRIAAQLENTSDS